MLTYKMNFDKRRQIVKSKKIDMPLDYKVLQIISKLCFLSIPVILVLLIVDVISTSSTKFIYLIINGVAVAFICCIIGLLVRAISNNKYMGIYLNYSDCEIHLGKQGFEYCASCNDGKEYRTWNINYLDIDKLEYNSYDLCLRVYTSMTIKNWIDHSRTNCISTSYIDRTYIDKKGNEHEAVLTLVEGYDNFEDFMMILSKLSGKQIDKQINK